MDEFKKTLLDIDNRISKNIYSYSDNKRFIAQRKIVREIMKKYAEHLETLDWIKKDEF